MLSGVYYCICIEERERVKGRNKNEMEALESGEDRVPTKVGTRENERIIECSLIKVNI